MPEGNSSQRRDLVAPRRPLIVVIGGTLRTSSSSELVLKLAAALNPQRLGADIDMLGRALEFAPYDPTRQLAPTVPSVC